MAKKRRKKSSKQVATLRHDEAKRANIPTAEYQSVMEKAEQSPLRVAYERRNRDLDPQLVWRGKDEQDWSDLVVQAPPLFIQEKVHPKVLIDDLMVRTKERKGEKEGEQIDLFADFNGLSEEATSSGRQEGRQEGLRQGKADLLKAQAGRRFGALPGWVLERIDCAGVDTLDRWGGRLLDAERLEDVFDDPE